MSPAARLEVASRILARRNLVHFIQRMKPTYEAGWVHRDIGARLERFSMAVRERKSPRLMILMPPRHGKSELASVRFPAWHLGHCPDHEIINCGYNMDLPMRFSRWVREIVRDKAYTALFENAIIDQESQSAEAWNVTAGGGFTAAGVGGGITGKGAHILIVDDPIKNQEEADSITTRDTLWDWYWSTAYTRLAPGGGVLVIQCMTGDTPVLLPDGTEKRLDQIRPGDMVATYEQGRLAQTRVAAWRSNGRDLVLKITTKSGRIVRANGRHPFLATTTTGELKWIRARSLSTANRIVTVRGSEESGKGLLAQLRGAQCPPPAEASVLSTTPRKNGLMATALRLVTRLTSERGTLSTAMASLQSSMMRCSLSSAAYAPFAVRMAAVVATPTIGTTSSPSIIATKPGRFVDYSATTATQPSDILELSPSHLPLHATLDFTLDEVVSVVPDGIEEVFDVQIDRTTNFIANGVVASNTWWNDDDLAGRLQSRMKSADGKADQFDVVKYPALAEQYEYEHNETHEIVRVEKPLSKENSTEKGSDLVSLGEYQAEDFTFLRSPGDALHPERYTKEMLENYRDNMPRRMWSALYQQNPVPDEGMYFQKEWLQFEAAPPALHNRNIYQAWDFAWGVKNHNDYTVGVTLIQDENNQLHLVDLVRLRGDTMTVAHEVMDAALKWGGEASCPLTIGFEGGAVWEGVKPFFHALMQERGVFPPYVELKTLTDKMARARNLQGRLQQRRVWLPTEAAWTNTVVTELLRFPAGAHDDIVDALAHAVNLCVARAPKPGRAQRRLKSWKDKIPGMLRGDGGGHMSA